jgi:hypothetical protein
MQLQAGLSLALEIRALHLEVVRAGQVALAKAREAGALLAGLPQAERAAVLLEAGVSARTGQVYVQIAER